MPLYFHTLPTLLLAEQRLAAYHYALAKYNPNTFHHYICISLKTWLVNNNLLEFEDTWDDFSKNDPAYYQAAVHLPILFPELAHHKPSNIEFDECWFDTDEERIVVLKSCIAEVADSISSTNKYSPP